MNLKDLIAQNVNSQFQQEIFQLNINKIDEKK